MGFLITALEGIVSSLAGRQIYDSSPHLSAWIVRKAARRLPKREDKERREEEWLAHLHDCPGLTGFYHAIGALVASWRLAFPFEEIAIRVSMWSLYFLAEKFWRFVVFKPIAKQLNAQAKYASQEEAQENLDTIATLAVPMVFMRMGHQSVMTSYVDRATLAHLSSTLWKGFRDIRDVRNHKSGR